ncbi:MAG: hypothetical protein FWE03_07385 [Firmicutes bacterium]|nr:hypothetical protein [Bacillota bacterium]
MKSNLLKKITDTNKLYFPASIKAGNIFYQYKNILDFYQKNTTLTTNKFDEALKNNLVLCTFFEQIDTQYIENLLKQIAAAMPHLIEVFRRPVTHLSEIETIVPVDMAKHITSKTVRHLMSNSQDWECIKKSKITPKNVLTKTYDDDYGIYENLVFKNLIDRILKLLKKQLHYLIVALKIYNESVSIDVFSRINHEQYYKAIGNLYSGFFNNFEEIETNALTKKIKQQLSLLTKYLSHPVYRKNITAKSLGSDIKQTNILLMHKDYKYVNKLWKQLGNDDVKEEEIDEKLQAKAQKAYEKYCEYLLIFAVRNFNFNEQFKFNKWQMTIKNKKILTVDIEAIELTIKHKKTQTKYLIVPCSYYFKKDKTKYYQDIKNKIGTGYDNIIITHPFDIDYTDQALPISIIEINSFRYFQKLLLEGMILTDNDKNICAFCGANLLENKCKKCRLNIQNNKCSTCEHNYISTKVDGVAIENAPFKTINKNCPNCKEESNL